VEIGTCIFVRYHYNELNGRDDLGRKFGRFAGICREPSQGANSEPSRKAGFVILNQPYLSSSNPYQGGAGSGKMLGILCLFFH
jgi:hypothetical protein